MADPLADHRPPRPAAAGSGEAPREPPLQPGPREQTPREEPSHPGVSLSPPGIVPESDVRTHSPAAANPARPRLPFEEDLGELPWGYDDGRLGCLIRDPTTLYVYWDLSRQHIEQAFGGLGSAQALLKLCALRGEPVREVPIHLDARGWYLRDLQPGSELRLELWALGEQGARLLRSGRPVRLPQAAPSGVRDELYAVLLVGLPLPRDGQISGGSPLDWKAGGEPPLWERRSGSRDFAGSRGSGAMFSSGAGPGEANPAETGQRDGDASGEAP